LLNQENDRLDFFFTANGFLKQMVRNIVGTLVDVGRGKIGSDAMGMILKAADRSLAGATAPGHGLCLMRVCYDDGETIQKEHMGTIGNCKGRPASIAPKGPCSDSCNPRMQPVCADNNGRT
jgi:tRNA U38,U39,U40 pseudouridine synthase TruA